MPGNAMKTITTYNLMMTAMKKFHVVAACMAIMAMIAIAAMLLMSCSTKDSTKVEASSGQSDATQKQPGMNNAAKHVLFEDPMTANWQEQWFLDGKLATLGMICVIIILTIY